MPNQQDAVINRRAALQVLSKATLATLFLGAGCTRQSSPTSTGETTTSMSLSISTAPTLTTLAPPPGPGFDWIQVDFGVANPYILHKEGRVVLADTGRTGCHVAIEENLLANDLSWASVEHIILTHRHRDSIGSLPKVAELAPSAAIWVGEADREDLPRLPDGREVGLAHEGERILDLTIIETPGHTPGHFIDSRSSGWNTCRRRSSDRPERRDLWTNRPDE